MPLKPPPDKTPENRRTQMYKGVLELAVLSLLKDGAQYGLKILDRMRDKVGLDFAEGTLYPLLHRLEKAGLVKPEWRMEQGISHPRKYYPFCCRFWFVFVLLITDETRQILERCAKSVDQERQIINQMLELSVLEGEETSLDYSVFSVGGMVNAVIAGGGYALKAEIAIDIPADLLIEADRQKLSYIIDVLVANGVSYSKPPKKIWITYRGSPSHPFHRLAIQDNGVGITEAQLDAIFKPEEGGSTGSSRQGLGGSGLSLAIAKKYVQLHGGYISVDSTVNIGSTFTIHIPKKRPEKANHHDT